MRVLLSVRIIRWMTVRFNYYVRGDSALRPRFHEVVIAGVCWLRGCDVPTQFCARCGRFYP